MVLEAEPIQDCSASNAPEILGVTGSLTVLALLAFCLRCYVRIYMLKFFGPDDWTMLAAALMAIGTFICFTGETYHGVGRHMSCISQPDFKMLFKFQFFHGLWVTFGQSLVKISIAFFLLRLAPTKSWKWFLRGSIVFIACFMIACAGTLIFACSPPSAYWDVSVFPNPACFSPGTYTGIGLFNSITNIVTDFLFALVPIPLIRMLRVNRRTKVTLGFILGLGGMACAAGIVKAHLQTIYFANPDRFWRDDFIAWNSIELCLGILAASLPPLKPLFSALLVSRISETETYDPAPAGHPATIGSAPVRPRFNSKGVQEILGDVEIRELESETTTVHHSDRGTNSRSHHSSRHAAEAIDEEVATIENKDWNSNSVFWSDSEEQLNRTPDK